MLRIINDAMIGYDTDLLDRILKHLDLKDIVALSSICERCMIAIEKVFSEKCNATPKLYPTYRKLLLRNRSDVDSSPAQMRVTKLNSSHIPKKWKLSEIAKELWLNSEAPLSEDMIDKVNRVDTNLEALSTLSLLPIPESYLRQFPPLSDPNPIPVMEYFYNKAETPEQKRACLCYLLYYQHYNAEFTEEEIHRLGYCSPLLAKQTKPGYIRTTHEPLFKLIKPWIKPHLGEFFKASSDPRSEPSNLVKLSATSATSVLKIFFKEQIREVASLKLIEKKKRICKEKKFIFFEINPSDLKKSAYDIVKERLQNMDLDINEIKKLHPNLRFIFFLQIPGIDCSLMWGARLPSPKRRDFKLQYMALESEEMFGKKKANEIGIFSLLNKAGAVPDRLALNAFLTEELGDKDFANALIAIGISNPITENYSPIHLLNTLAIWRRQIEEIDSYTITDDPGSELYRKAILQWHACFFEHYELTKFAAPLLYSQVSPWISNATEDKEIVQWAKAYQNLCEIVMFCLQTFSEKFSKLNLESILLDSLQNKRKLPANVQTSIGLFPYAMTGFLHIFGHLLQRFEALQQPFIMTHLCHNYFETFNLLELLGTKSPLISSTKVDWIEDINEFPNVLIADIHPNNATKEILSQNNIAEWIQSTLEKNPSKTMILILDITLNHLSDPILQRTLEKLVPFIEREQLEIFGIQSLAKLVQVGADNFSGGICLHLRNSSKNSNLNFPSPIPEKARFFSLMSRHFQHITADYFEQVRSNTNLMYEILNKGFSDISEIVSIKESVMGDDGKFHQIIRPFCAAKINLNGDNSTVYVAINFIPLIEEIELEKKHTEEKNELISRLEEKHTKEKENLISKLETKHTEEKEQLISKLKTKHTEEKEQLINSLRNLIIKLAETRKLPLTARQSFGFSLSNMSQTGETIRFSLGIENKKLMLSCADVVIDFIYALSMYVAKGPRQFDIKEFETNVEKIIKILESGEMDPITAPLCEETFDEHFDKTLEPVGNIEIHFKNHQFSLKISENNGDCLVYPMALHPNIVIDEYSLQNPHSVSILLRFIFHVICLNTKPTHVTVQTCQGKNQYTIHGIFEDHFPFLGNKQIVDPKSKIKFDFESNFPFTLPDSKRFTRNQVFVNIQELNMGSVPVKLSKLDAKKYYVVFKKCICHYFELVPYGYEHGAFLLKFTSPKLSLNYLEKIKELFRNGLPAVVNFINDLNLEELPVASDDSWKFQQKSLERVFEVLKALGAHIRHRLTEEIISQIIEIKFDNCKKAFLDGIVEGLLSDSLDVNKNLKPEVAKIFASLFGRKNLPIPVDGVTFDQWIKDLQEYIKKYEDKSHISRLRSYLIAFFPQLKLSSLGKVPLSISSIRDIGERTRFQPILDHIAVLENRFLEKAKDVKKFQSLTKFLKVYVFYPLSDENKKNLLNNLATLSEELRKKWIYNPKFYYYPLDRIEIHLDSATSETDLIFKEEDQALIQAFFDVMEGKALLLKNLLRSRDGTIATALRWAFITQDDELFSLVLQNCDKLINYPSQTLEKLQFYQEYLDNSNPIQLELINFINKWANK
ncbi:Uncharacterized protein PRO82_001883 [Candidatus Protochlamydia amoebophila]|uniref:F-box protein n=1 Tax=Candidatus Protochlamydia amoebophila TaxID=362787 RepID=UPI001BCA327A|nr:F-box protein [Candidatus Protochlamydia amoebophila]MBS4164553.1 Uncharacterized protein [Candidatus Protochlamydia amoebophila]